MLEMPFFATSQNLALEESKGRKQFLTLLTFGCLSHSCVSNKVVPPSTVSMGDMHTHLSRWGK